jgi:mono/diheme cytochrome c family protein
MMLVVVTLSLVLLAACGGPGGGSKTQDIEQPTPPAEYSGKVNPLADQAGAIDTGKQLYAANCASCHGVEAMGDGPASASLNPQPKPLAMEMKALSDDYLYWRIAEGGAFSPFSSAMPAWKRSLSEDEIWQIIAFLRTLQR